MTKWELRVKKLLIALTVVSGFWGCGPVKVKSIPPVLGDQSPKEKTTVTTHEELPKIAGAWEGYCYEEDQEKVSDKLTRLIFRQSCGASTMILDLESKKLNFEFGREFFEYYISAVVSSCSEKAQHCECHEHDGNRKCTQFSVGKGECTLKVSAEIQDTTLVERKTFLGDYLNRYLRLVNLNSELVYLSDEVEKTKIPDEKKMSYDFYKNNEKAKANCESFASIWKDNKEPLNLVYKLGEDSKSVIFPGQEDNPLALNLFGIPLMAFQK